MSTHFHISFFFSLRQHRTKYSENQHMTMKLDSVVLKIKYAGKINKISKEMLMTRSNNKGIN